MKTNLMHRPPFGAVLITGLVLLVAGCQPLPPAADVPLLTQTPVLEATTTSTDTVAVETATPMMPPPTAVVTSTATPSVEETPMNETPFAAPVYDPAMEPLVQRAVNDLAQKLSIAPEEITVVEAQAVVWPDASIGCPQPDMMYIQVPQDGAFIQLRAGDQLYNYHNGGRRGLFLCELTNESGAPPSFDELQLPGGGGEDM